MIVDDSGDQRFGDWLCGRYAPAFEIVSHGSNWGYTETLATVWEEIAEGFGSPYIFHLEEDFEMDRPVRLADLATVLEAEPMLAQIVLLRQACYPREYAAGGIIQEHPESYRQRKAAGVPYLEHERFFSANPCLYRRELTEIGWPRAKHSEAVIGPMLVKLGYRFAYLGRGEPWITHIGLERVGGGR